MPENFYIKVYWIRLAFEVEGDSLYEKAEYTSPSLPNYQPPKNFIFGFFKRREKW